MVELLQRGCFLYEIEKFIVEQRDLFRTFFRAKVLNRGFTVMLLHKIIFFCLNVTQCNTIQLGGLDD